jgi:hypothetical protein
VRAPPPLPLPPRTNWTRLVPSSVLTGQGLPVSLPFLPFDFFPRAAFLPFLPFDISLLDEWLQFRSIRSCPYRRVDLLLTAARDGRRYLEAALRPGAWYTRVAQSGSGVFAAWKPLAA